MGNISFALTEAFQTPDTNDESYNALVRHFRKTLQDDIDAYLEELQLYDKLLINMEKNGIHTTINEELLYGVTDQIEDFLSKVHDYLVNDLPLPEYDKIIATNTLFKQKMKLWRETLNDAQEEYDDIMQNKSNGNCNATT